MSYKCGQCHHETTPRIYEHALHRQEDNRLPLHLVYIYRAVSRTNRGAFSGWNVLLLSPPLFGVHTLPSGSPRAFWFPCHLQVCSSHAIPKRKIRRKRTVNISLLSAGKKIHNCVSPLTLRRTRCLCLNSTDRPNGSLDQYLTAPDLNGNKARKAHSAQVFGR